MCIRDRVSNIEGWVLDPTSPHGVNITVAPGSPLLLEEVFQISAPTGSTDTPSPTSITASETLTLINSVRIGNFTSGTLTATQLNTLSNWSLITGDNTSALINAGSYRVNTVVGDYFYVAIPTSLIGANMPTFTVNTAQFTFDSNNINTVGDYTVYRGPRVQQAVQQLTWTINIS